MPFSNIRPTRVLIHMLSVNIVQEDVARLVRVDKILGRTGSRGGVIQVKVQFIDDETRYVLFLHFLSFMKAPQGQSYLGFLSRASFSVRRSVASKQYLTIISFFILALSSVTLRAPFVRMTSWFCSSLSARLVVSAKQICWIC